MYVWLTDSRPPPLEGGTSYRRPRKGESRHWFSLPPFDHLFRRAFHRFRNLPWSSLPKPATLSNCKPATTMTTPALREALNDAISSGKFVDTKIVLFSRRDGAGRVCKPKSLYANSHVLRTVPYFENREPLLRSSTAHETIILPSALWYIRRGEEQGLF